MFPLNEALKRFQRRSRHRDTMSRSLKLTSRKYSPHSFHPTARRQTVCRCDPPPPPPTPESFCRPGPESAPHLPLSLFPPSSVGSGDNLWLPGLASHLGATLRDDRRARRGLTVQTEAADHVLKSRAFRLPLLQRQRGKKSFLSVRVRESIDVSHRLWFVLFSAHK